MWLIPWLALLAALPVLAFIVAPRDELRDLIDDMEIYSDQPNVTGLGQYDQLRQNILNSTLDVDIDDLKTEEIAGSTILLAWTVCVSATTTFGASACCSIDCLAQ